MSEAMRYAEMKDSGVEWLGEIPRHWDTYLLSQVVVKVKNKNNGLREDNLLSLSYGKIKRKNINNAEGLLPGSFEGYNVIESGDIVLRLTDLQNDHTSLRVGLAKERGIITSAYVTIRPSSEIRPEFLYYLLHAFDIRKGFYGMGAGVRQGLNFNEVKTLKIIVPNDKSQEEIASYLNNQCAQIDDIITSAKVSIEDYKQWKASVIYEAVTKGLNPDAEMKDSGVEWIGRMPSHWESCSLKYLCSMQVGKNLTSEQITDEGAYPVYGGNGSRGFFSEYNSSGKVLLVGRQGALCGNVHRANGKIWATKHAVLTHNCPSTEIDFLYYLLLAMNLNQYSSSAAQLGITVGVISNIKVVLPPSSEQKYISEHLESICIQIDQLIIEKEVLIADLESYKKSLIYEVVTGKRKVG